MTVCLRGHRLERLLPFVLKLHVAGGQKREIVISAGVRAISEAEIDPTPPQDRHPPTPVPCGFFPTFSTALPALQGLGSYRNHLSRVTEWQGGDSNLGPFVSKAMLFQPRALCRSLALGKRLEKVQMTGEPSSASS